MPITTKHPVPLPIPKKEVLSRIVTCWGAAFRNGFPHAGQDIALSETLFPHSGQLMIAITTI